MKGYKTTSENIKRITEKVKQLWLKNPDLRLGQFLNCFIFKSSISLFNQYDEITEKELDRLLSHDIYPYSEGGK
jgi:hypothetical protein